MNKKIIALAVAAAFSTSAFADTSNVEVYGQANMSFDRTNNGTTSTNQVSDNLSRIGLKGTEDLGDGLSAIWQVESNVGLDVGGGTFSTRNSFVGLSSADMGTVLAGNHDSPYRMATEGADLFNATIADYRSLMGVTSATAGTFGAHNVRLANVLAYMTPDFGGFSGAIGYAAQAEAKAAVGTPSSSALSLAGMYDMGGINASLSYQEMTDVAGVTGDDQKAWKVGVGYTMDAINVNAVYEKVNSDGVVGSLLGNSDDHNAWYLSGKYSMGNDAVKLAYTKLGDFSTAAGATIANSGAKQWALGYDHSLSKRTTLFALYTKVDVEAATPGGVGTLGRNHLTAAVVPTGIAGGARDANAWSFGVKHSF